MFGDRTLGLWNEISPGSFEKRAVVVAVTFLAHRLQFPRSLSVTTARKAGHREKLCLGGTNVFLCYQAKALSDLGAYIFVAKHPRLNFSRAPRHLFAQRTSLRNGQKTVRCTDFSALRLVLVNNLA